MSPTINFTNVSPENNCRINRISAGIRSINGGQLPQTIDNINIQKVLMDNA